MTLAITEQPGLSDQINFAQALAAADLLPRAYRDKPANVLLAMQTGYALGLPPAEAINSIHVIEGKPSMSADLMAALVRRAGHKLRIAETATADGPSVTATLIRRDDPDFAFTVTWDRAKARAAGLLGKGTWKAYEGQMMRNRAITEVARQGASEVLHGVIYDPEELGGLPENAPAKPEARQVVPATTTADEAVQSAAETIDGPLTTEQGKAIGRLIRELGIEKAEGLALFAAHIGHEVKATADLTTGEAALVIAAMSVIAAEAEAAERVDATTGEVYEAELLPQDGAE